MFCSRTWPRATTRSLSSVMVISHSCWRRPRWIGVDTAVTVPDEMARRKSVLLFTPDDGAAAVLAEPYLTRDAGQALDDRAVHAAVHDAPRLQQLVVDLQLRPPAVGGQLEVVEAESRCRSRHRVWRARPSSRRCVYTRCSDRDCRSGHASRMRTGPAHMARGPPFEWTGGLCSPQDSGSVRWSEFRTRFIG